MSPTKSRVELADANRENIAYIVAQLKTKLQIVNTQVIKAESFQEEDYTELLDLYEYVMSKENISVAEMQSIIEEMGRLRSE